MSIFVLHRNGFPLVVWLGRNLATPGEASESRTELAQSPPSATRNNESPCSLRMLPTSAAQSPQLETETRGILPKTLRLLKPETRLDAFAQTLTFKTPESC